MYMIKKKVVWDVATARSMARVGVDIGTSNCCTYIRLDDDHPPELVPSLAGGRLTPSVIAYTNKEVLVGEPAQQQQESNPHRTFLEFKRLLNVPYTDQLAKESRAHWAFGLLRPTPDEGRGPRLGAFHQDELLRLTPQQLYTVLLTEMRRAIRQHVGAGVKILSACVTVPAHFDPAQRLLTIEAAKRAGFPEDVSVMNEPTAAMLAYLERFPSKFAVGDRAIVVDLGAGTLDVSCVRIDEGKRMTILAAPKGCKDLGGADFDRRLLDMAAKHHKTHVGTHLKSSKKRLAAVKQACERAKCALSVSGEAAIVVSDDAPPLTVTRDEFSAAIAPDVARIASTILEALRGAKLDASDVKHVVLCGGSTRIPSVRSAIRRLFSEEDGAEILTNINPDECVALGACLSAQNKVKETAGATVGVLTGVNVMTPLVRKNDALPASSTITLFPYYDEQTYADVHVYQGEHADVRRNKHLGGIRLEGLRPESNPKVLLKLTMTSQGCIEVEAQDSERRSVVQGKFRYA